MTTIPAHPHAPDRAAPPDTLVELFTSDDVALLSNEELRRFIPGHDPVRVRRRPAESWHEIKDTLAWELLYRKHPDLYVRLTKGETFHPGCMEVLGSPRRAVEVGAGWGRLTLDLAEIAGEVVAVEPALPLRDMLSKNLADRGAGNVRIENGFFDALPVPDGWADLCVAASAFTSEDGHGGEAGLKEMFRVVRPGGLVAVIWPGQPAWLEERGFVYKRFDGEMAVEFSSNEEAVDIARIFYPKAVDWIERAGGHKVPYEVLGISAPRDVCWRAAP